MSRTLDELEAAVHRTLDWQARVQRQPLLYAGVALAVGFVVAGGPGRLIRHTYYRLRPAARDKALANQYTLRLRSTLDQTLGGLPPVVAEQAKALRLIIQRTDPKAKSDGTIVIEHKPSAVDRALVGFAETAASTAATILINRLLQEMDGKEREERG